ncbi:hypothetical protein [Skermania sp. ID1734]|uniref:hypothetical protein n=1 Tax=Skermania sp. ID1734 TaxID=2597516 RepID=UPI00163D6D77|nr:hypothetical protein [Skermania sp. ID1734]
MSARVRAAANLAGGEHLPPVAAVPTIINAQPMPAHRLCEQRAPDDKGWYQ